MYKRLAIVILLLSSCQNPPEESIHPRTVKAMQVGDAAGIASRGFPGKIRAEERANLSFRVEGPLIQLPIFVGMDVKKGDLLARIDPRDYELKLRNIEAKLSGANAELDFASRDFARAEKIQKEDSGAISQSMVDRKRETQNSLKAEVLSLQSQVQAAKDALEDTILRAPYDGKVVARFVQNFEHVQAKQDIVRLLGSERMEMIIDVPETLISYMPYIDQVEIMLDAFAGRVFSAKIKEIGAEAVSATRTYPVTLVLDQPNDVTILAGMAGQARLKAVKMGSVGRGSGIMIAITALFDDENLGDSFVWVYNPKTETISRRKVDLGPITQEGVMITSGLESGEWVVTAGVRFLHEGEHVKLLE